MLSHRSLLLTCLFCVFLVAGIPSYCDAQQNFDQVQIQTDKLAEGVYMLTGSGGNIGVCEGDDGVLMVDSQYAGLTDKIRAAVAAHTWRFMIGLSRERLALGVKHGANSYPSC